eukprot:TRINITY_DN22328_c0_g1_i1.p1 TRINITY_DN22328_c0_g1~~TRINITY_DN22328_c0_g1_i1.p1  ORF type:complete len:599 (+),score=64.52 TRINITY_DN22328_c0_g1_i1:28-1824(+)
MGSYAVDGWCPVDLKGKLLQFGDAVRVKGLVKAAEYNGCQGVISAGPLVESGRYIVRVDLTSVANDQQGADAQQIQYKALLLKPDNLEVRATPEAPRRVRADQLPPGYVAVFTQVLPDGLGDLTFGEAAVKELSDIAPVVWVRCYTSGDNFDAGERLVRDTAQALVLEFAEPGGEKTAMTAEFTRDFEQVWSGARERFLAPWIFGLGRQEQLLLMTADRTKAGFWALTEYGRGMGNIDTYSGGLGCKIPTGWIPRGKEGGVFKSIRRAPRLNKDWRAHFADHLGLPDASKVRLWWFYSRAADEKKHDIKFLDGRPASEYRGEHVRDIAKVLPLDSKGNLATSVEKTHGEKLAEQLGEAVSNPDYQLNTDVVCEEVKSGCAGQLSLFLAGALFASPVDGASLGGERCSTLRKLSTDEASDGYVDVLVAPNLMTSWREASGRPCVAGRLRSLELASSRGDEREEVHVKSRTVYLCSARIPRADMRTFLEQCEDRVYTTGDQSMSEAVLLGKIPCIRPDAKVEEWSKALEAHRLGVIDQVPDLGNVLRDLVTNASCRTKARSDSKRASLAVEQSVKAQLGGLPPDRWQATQWTLVKAGMFG